METPLLTTKLRLPPTRPRARVVLRPRQWEHLSANAHCCLILVSVAGSGKTAMIGEWLHHQAGPAAWLTLDESDDDPARFWRYLITACRIALPNVGQTTLNLLQGTPPPVEAAITSLELVSVSQVETRIVRNAKVER